VKDALEPVDRILFNVDRLDALLDELSTDASVSRDRASPPGSETIIDPKPAFRIPLAEGARRPYGATSGPAAIPARGLERRFGDHVAVTNLDLSDDHGEIYGFLGANSAGKSTTLKMLVGLLAPTQGHVSISGHDISDDAVEAKRTLGYVPDRAILYGRLSGREFLQFLAQMRGIPQGETARRIDRLLDAFELSDRQSTASSAYSFGMKRKLSLAGALIHEPSVLILDEPLNGLDPRSARHLKDYLHDVSRNGVGILLRTHDLATAADVCDRIGIIHRGRLLAEGTVGKLTSGASESRLESAFLRYTSEAPGVDRERV
jgi:ABC-2 type transport system ATP-binding protein